MSIPRGLFAVLAFALAFVIGGCSSNEPTMVQEDPTVSAGTDAEGSFPDADADEMKEMEAAAAAGEAP